MTAHCCTPDPRGVTRREAGALGALAVAAGLPGLALAQDRSAHAGQHGGTAPLAPLVAPFALDRVRLLDGPFRAAQQRTLAYLLALDPDRLLHGFRANAGLPPRAPVYGGWESEPLWTEIHCQGHTLGHYLSGCAMMLAATGDARLRTRLVHIVEELAHCQKAAGSGLLSAFPEGPRLMADVVAGRPVSGVPWYTLHKVMAGLRDADAVGGIAAARPVLLAMADWAVVATRPLDDAAFEAMLGAEHGGMNEVFADLHALTGQADYAALARRFSHKAVLAPLAAGEDRLDGLHANTQIPKVIGFRRVAETQGDASCARAAGFFWDTVIERRSYACGGHGDGEHFFPVDRFAEHVFSAKGSETCGIYNMLKLTQMLFAADPQARYADYAERALFNGILGSQDAASGMVTYFQGGRPGYVKLYSTPEHSFWCCTGSGMENHARHGAFVYGHDARGVWVNQFIASRLDWRERGAVLTQRTAFPDDGTVTLDWQLRRPQALALNLRHPGWSATLVVKVNGAEVLRSDQPGRYLRVNRTWRDGDRVEIALALALAVEPLPGSPDIVAFRHGPVVLAGALGSEGVAPDANLVVNERLYGDYVPAPFTPPQLAGTAATVLARIRPAGAGQTFAVEASDGRTVRLVPYYRITRERLATYWKLAPPA